MAREMVVQPRGESPAVRQNPAYRQPPLTRRPPARAGGRRLARRLQPLERRSRSPAEDRCRAGSAGEEAAVGEHGEMLGPAQPQDLLEAPGVDRHGVAAAEVEQLDVLAADVEQVEQ